MLFHRFYSGAGVCSPTRASVLTGRNNKRSCINSALPCDHMATEADGCSQGPGLAKSEFTVAKAAAKVGMNTIHLGKVRRTSTIQPSSVTLCHESRQGHAMLLAG